MISPVLILLAGGKSTRMGTPKGLLNYFGKPWILEQICRYKPIENPKVIIGLGYDYKQYFKEIPWFKSAINHLYKYNGVTVQVVINKEPEYGSFSTLQTVLHTVNLKNTILVQPIDVPLLNNKELRLIIRNTNKIVIPTCDAKNGHPVKLNPTFWNILLAIDKTSDNARLDVQIKKENPLSIKYLNVLDNSVYQNINTKEDWKKHLQKNTS